MLLRISRTLAPLALYSALLWTGLSGVKTHAQGPAQSPLHTPSGWGQTFLTRCASCHGTTGNGGEFAPGITTRIPQRTDDDLVRILHNACLAPACPPFPTLWIPIAPTSSLTCAPCGLSTARRLPCHGAARRRRQPGRLRAQPLR